MRAFFITLSVAFAITLVGAELAPPIGFARAQSTQKPAALAGFKVEQLTLPAGDDTAEPSITAEGDRVILSWLDTHGDDPALKFSERTATGWAEPRTVVANSKLMVMPADVPSLRALAGGSLVAAWLEDNGGDGEAYDLLLASSKDAGRTWTKATTPHHDGTKTQHGFPSIVATPGGGFSVIWLDGRAQDPETGKGDMSLRIADYGGDFAERRETAIDNRVCDCCPLSNATTADGLIVAYRDRSPEEIRDIFVRRLIGGKWSEAIPVHRDGWKIEGCPVNGPSVAARGTTVAVAWYTGQGNSERTFVAFSADGGQTFGEPTRLDDGKPLGRVQLALLKDGSAAASWVELVEPGTALKLRRVDRSGARGPAVTIAQGVGSTHPKLAQAGDELFFTWAESVKNTNHVRVARVM